MRYQATSTRRSGVVLLVVMALLAIFAALGLSFVFYADNEATASLLNSQAQVQDQADIDRELLMAYFLNQLIYDSDNPHSALRGWSLARSIYGGNPNGLNYIPFNGIGRAALSGNGVNFSGTNVDYFNLINYQRYEVPAWNNATLYFAGNDVFSGGNIYRCTTANQNQIPPNAGFWSPQPADPLMNIERKPEFYGKTGDANFRYVGGANPPWTFYDTNSLFLAQMNATGDLTLPSFFRPWTNTAGDLNAKAKYMSLRPDLNWNPQFLTPDSDLGGDVRNHEDGRGTLINGTWYNNDSRWMDLGFPILTAPNGKRYRPLFAPLIVDLNNRLHLGAHGNADNVANQGFGPPEVNLAKLPGIDTNAANLAELKNYLLWRATTTPAGTANGIRGGPWYAPVDPDGSNGGTSTAPLILAGAGPPYSMFPTFPTGWDNTPASGNATLGFDPTLKPLPASHMEALLRHFDTNSPALTSELFRQMPTILSNRRARHLVTTHGWGLDRIMAAPVISWDPSTPATNPVQYRLAPGTFYPSLTGPVPPPAYGTPSTYPANSEYTADWRSSLGTMLRVNLNRALTDFPAPNAMSNQIIDTGAFTTAQTERQQFARDIYNALIRVIGAQDPNSALPANVVAGSPDYNAARWLAQFAVNIVDYIDNDDCATPFNWYGTEWLFGTELPRLLLNEVYAQHDNDPADKGITDPVMAGMPQATYTQLNIWIELHNPFKNTPTGDAFPNDGGAAWLTIAGEAQYDVVVCPSSEGLSAALRDPANHIGDPEFNNAGMKRQITQFDDWPGRNGNKGKGKGKAKGRAKGPPPAQVLPANGVFADTTGTNVGFYVLGPEFTDFLPGRDPSLPVSYDAPEMTISTPAASPLITELTVVLRRLAIPHLPAQPDPTKALYNPLITIDYLENINIAPNDGRVYDAAGLKNPAPGAWTTFKAWGRNQPYAAHKSQSAFQSGAITGTNPQNSLFQHNSNTANKVFDWLVHLDRPPINQLELLHVCACKQHQLTQKFVVDTTKFGHYAPWSDANSMIYRVLDVLGTPSPMAGSIRGGRWAGSVNLNTVTDVEVLRALGDANGISFTEGQVNTLFTNLVTSRTAGGLEGSPFKSFAAGNRNDTYLRSDPADAARGLFQVGAATAHPYQQAALLQKIYNNITTTSNVFAVWWTVGYFEVLDETVRPARLGREIGRDENRHIRHRFFAIVDRSALQLFAGRCSTAVTAGLNAQTMTCDPNAVSTIGGPATAWNNTQSYVPSNTVVDAGVAYFCIQANNNTPTTNTAFWQPVLQAGMLLEVDTGANAEVVAVTAVTGSSITAIFTKSHAVNAPMICRGNPGPRTPPPGTTIPPAWVPYNPRQDANVVLHMSMIR